MQYKPFKAPVFSFFSRDLYRSVVKDWGGIAFGYLFLLVFALSALYSVKLQLGFSDFMGNEFSKAFEQMPEFNCKNGKFICEAEMPYTIKDPKTDEIILVIDTRENTEFPDDAKIKITETEASVKRNAFETRTFRFAEFPDFDKAAVKKFFELMILMLIPVFFVVWLIGSFTFAAMQVLIYALIGMLFAKLLKVELDYQALVRLAVVAVTPVLIIDFILKIAGIEFPMGLGMLIWPPLTGAIALGYLFYGVKVNSTSPQEETSSGESL